MTDNDSNERWFQHALQQAPWRTQTQTTSLMLVIVRLTAGWGRLPEQQHDERQPEGGKSQARTNKNKCAERNVNPKPPQAIEPQQSGQ